MYCGWENYGEVASGYGASIHNFGLSSVGNAEWKILACSECGHIQMFRLDKARRDNLWQT